MLSLRDKIHSTAEALQGQIISPYKISVSGAHDQMSKHQGKAGKAIFKVLRRSFDQRQQFFDLLLRSYGGSVQALDNMGHYRELLKCWSPGQAKVWDPKSEEIDWLRPVTDLCQFSELAPRRAPEQGFFLDGCTKTRTSSPLPGLWGPCWQHLHELHFLCVILQRDLEVYDFTGSQIVVDDCERTMNQC